MARAQEVVRAALAAGALGGVLWLAGCGGGSSQMQPPPPPPPPQANLITIVVAPPNAVIADAGAGAQAFTATGYYSDGSTQTITASVSWNSSNNSVAKINSAGMASSQALPGGHSAGFTTITATKSGVTGKALLSVVSHTGNGFAGVFTQHNDIARTGQNLNETILTPTVVSQATFGKKFSQPVDGFIFAQPLYVPNVSIGGALHNVVYVATENDSVFAFDADSNAGANANPLWQASMIDTAHGATAGETPVDSNNDIGCTDLIPIVGITSTPVIDPAAGLMYVEAKSKLTNGTFIHRLHLLDITTGNEKAPGPAAITATVAGTGDGGNTITFNPLMHLNRPGLLLVNGVIYLGYASHCDNTPYHGWVFAYDATALTQKGVFNTTPNGGLGGIWMSGSGLASDSQASIFTATGNGVFDTTGTVVDFGDTIFRMSLSSGSLVLADYFTPYDQEFLAANDTDVASGGVLLLPDQPGGHPHELVEVGKEGTIYLVDRDQMTTGNRHYCANCNSDTQIVEELPAAIQGLWSMPAYWNNSVYFWGSGDTLQAYPLSNGMLALNSEATSPFQIGFPGATPSVSSNGTTNGLVWAIDSSSYGPPAQATAGPAVLYAFDATNVGNVLYSSANAANGRDTAGLAVKFSVPTIANGKVYIGTQTELDVYGP